ncbi:MAG: type III pantothenate kinase [Patiriisocius sp.]|jgi:type III pantothenate kinase
MRILVDIGNSRFKSAIEDSDGIHELETFAWKDSFLHEALEKVWLKPLKGQIPHSVHVSNVAGQRLLPNLSAWCCSHFDQQPVAVTSEAQFNGLKNSYQEPATFGVDRWAAMIGARSEHSGALCVIDSGTATTVDLIDASGQHLGGAILPGIYTMRRSLGKYTSALFAADGLISPFSDNTASGIAGGTGYASVGAMDRLVFEAEQLVSDLTTVVTGGESQILESMMHAYVIRDPLLVLKGVSVIAGEMSAEEISQASCCN